ncbi:SpoIIE family protein phosphatase [Paucibacter sp. AS339]|uniref:SpoIIE family protein phosphatase n=1 Tax=Paucibacter hankyongi TaxID=3133434 RepID=UPI00309E6DF3
MPSSLPSQPPKPAPGSRRLTVAAWLSALLLGAMALGFVLYAAREVHKQQSERIRLEARVLEAQTSSALAEAEALLRALQPWVARLEPSAGPADEQLNTLLQDSLAGRPFLRSLSWLDAAGRVRASSEPANRGQQISAQTLGLPRPRFELGLAHLAPLAQGRELHELNALATASARPGAANPDPKQRLALPMLMMLGTPEQPSYLLALINPEHFATQFERYLDGSPSRALLLTQSGHMLVGSAAVHIPAGTSLRDLTAVQRQQNEREFASDDGPGSDGSRVLSAFRLTRAWPLLLLVEQPYAQLRHELTPVLAWALGFLWLGWTCLVGAHWAIQRALRRDQRMRLDVDAAQAATRRSEQRKLAILQSSPDGIVTIDAQGRVIDFNTSAERMFGYAAAEAIGRPMHELLVPPQQHQAHLAGMARYRSSGVPHVLNQRLELEAQCANGKTLPVELTIVSVMTEAGELFTATLRDISARLRTEKALRASRELLDKTGRIGAIGGWEFDVETHELRWTEETLRIHDLEPDQQPTLQQAIEYFAPEAQAPLREAMQLSIARGEGFDLELPLITAKGRRLWVRAVSRADMVDGKPVRLSGAIQDITARRRVEAELQAARQRELQVGARIQQSLLVTPTPPQIDGLQISSYGQASQGIDGDFVEVVRMGEHCVDIITGDVMGKGLAAAMMGAATKLQFSRSIAELLTHTIAGQALPRPAAVVAAVHQAMTPALQGLDAFVTLCYLRIDTAAGRLTWVGCGHEETLLIHADGSSRSLPNQHPPLGVLDQADYREDELDMASDDALFLCSDGVTDALRDDGERIGRERVAAAVIERVLEHDSPAAVLHSLRRDLLGGKVELKDDVTLVLAQGHRRTAARIELPLQLASLRALRGFIGQHCLKAGLDELASGLLEVAGVEAFTNIVRHGKGLLAGAPAELLIRREGQNLLLELIHLGQPFEPPEQLPETNFGEFPEGGFGLEIIHGASDSVRYLHHEGVNTIRMSKRLPAGRA